MRGGWGFYIMVILFSYDNGILIFIKMLKIVNDWNGKFFVIFRFSVLIYIIKG